MAMLNSVIQVNEGVLNLCAGKMFRSKLPTSGGMEQTVERHCALVAVDTIVHIYISLNTYHRNIIQTVQSCLLWITKDWSTYSTILWCKNSRTFSPVTSHEEQTMSNAIFLWTELQLCISRTCWYNLNTSLNRMS